MSKTILVRAATSQDDLVSSGATVESSHDTIAQAKERARYYISDAYAKAAEISSALGYAQVLVNGRCAFDVKR
jgi:hypothetical protein